MTTSPRLIVGLTAAALLGFALPGQAQDDACGLLAPADLGALLGGAAVAKPKPGACTWTAAGSRRKLLAVKMKTSGAAAETAFAGARRSTSMSGKFTVTDEAGIGDKAFAVQTAFGVALYTLKGGRLLQLQFWTNTIGTPRDLEALRPVARKAAAAF